MNTRTNIVLDDELVNQAMARAGVTTKKAAVEAALRAYVRKPDYTGLLALAGSGVIADDYDPDEHFFNRPFAPMRVSEPAPRWEVERVALASAAGPLIHKPAAKPTAKPANKSAAKPARKPAAIARSKTR